MTDTAESDRPCRECTHPLGEHSGFGNCLAMTETPLASATVRQSCACPGYAPIPPARP